MHIIVFFLHFCSVDNVYSQNYEKYSVTAYLQGLCSNLVL